MENYSSLDISHYSCAYIAIYSHHWQTNRLNDDDDDKVSLKLKDQFISFCWSKHIFFFFFSLCIIFFFDKYLSISNRKFSTLPNELITANLLHLSFQWLNHINSDGRIFRGIGEYFVGWTKFFLVIMLDEWRRKKGRRRWKG